MSCIRSILSCRLLPTLLVAALAGCDTTSPASGEDTCPSVDGMTGPGTRHAGTLDADQRWAAASSPHIVDASLSILGGAALTIEPCAVVRVAPGARIEVGAPDGAGTGRIVARGTADEPILIERAGGGAWGAIVVHAPSSLELAHATVSGGGADDFVGGASLVGIGAGTTPAASVLFVDDVTVTGSRGHGVRLDRVARFAAGSRALTITDSGDDARAEPLVVGLHGLSDLPDGRYTGNARDEILILEDQANDIPGLQVNTTLRDLGVPYRVGLFPGDDLRVGGNGGAPATLTIAEGVVLRFQPEGQLRVVSDDDQPRGRLVVAGTRTRPVTFTSLRDADGPGAWAGFYFEAPHQATMAEHEVAYARVVNAGGDCSCALTSCSPVTTSNGAVIFDGRPARVFMRDSVIVASAAHGFVRSWLDAEALDFLRGNVVEGVAECAQTTPQLSEQVCPASEFACAQ